MKILGNLGFGPNKAGGPFAGMFGAVRNITTIEEVKGCSAVVFWGGTDISPTLYHEIPNKFNEADVLPSSRDLFEWGVMKECIKNGIGIIGVCRGAQLLCAFSGGKLLQDIGGHSSGHAIVTATGEIFSAPGNHHQMMWLPGEARLIGWAHGISHDFYLDQHNCMNTLPRDFKAPEVAYFPNQKGIGFQYHPEWAQDNARAVTFAQECVEEYVL